MAVVGIINPYRLISLNVTFTYAYGIHSIFSFYLFSRGFSIWVFSSFGGEFKDFLPGPNEGSFKSRLTFFWYGNVTHDLWRSSNYDGPKIIKGRKIKSELGFSHNQT